MVGLYPIQMLYSCCDRLTLRDTLHISLSVLLEECPYDEYLESTQRNNKQTLYNRKPNNSRLSRPNRRKITVLPRSEILLRTRYYQHRV
jgi:hypothetical protein